jgi:hypothetical protein
MKILIGKTGSGKSYLVLNSYNNVLVSFIESMEDFKNYAESSEIGYTVLMNIYNRFDFKVLKDYVDYNIILEFHRDVKIPKAFLKYIVKVEVNQEEIKKFCGRKFDNWYKALIYKKYNVIYTLPKKRSELYYIKKLGLRYYKFKSGGWLKYVQ